MTPVPPRICCLDLDTFFVSVERLLDPDLEGKPVIVGGRPGTRGVVTACSYEVREFGVKSGMSLRDASRLAPHALFLGGRVRDYSAYSKRVREIIDRYSPEVQAASIDEFFIDFTGCERLYEQPEDADGDATILRTVWHMCDAIKEEIGLPASCGVAASRPVSKIASGLAKPRGVIMVPGGAEREFLAPLPCKKFPGIGPVAAQKLLDHGIRTLGELADTSDEGIKHLFGAWADYVREGVRGEGIVKLGDDRPAFREHDPEGGTVGSISNERTFREDVGDPHHIERMLCSLAERVCWRARKRGVVARTVTLKLRYADFETITRARSVRSPTSEDGEVLKVVMALYRKNRTRDLSIRLLGIALSNLSEPAAQLDLFADHSREKVHRQIDRVREKYGYKSVGLAGGRSLHQGVVRTEEDPRS